LNPAPDVEQLVGCPQVLLYGALSQEQPPRYLCVGQPLAHQLEDLPLACGERQQGGILLPP
jgi:hypothetical protein